VGGFSSGGGGRVGRGASSFAGTNGYGRVPRAAERTLLCKSAADTQEGALWQTPKKGKPVREKPRQTGLHPDATKCPAGLGSGPCCPPLDGGSSTEKAVATRAGARPLVDASGAHQTRGGRRAGPPCQRIYLCDTTLVRQSGGRALTLPAALLAVHLCATRGGAGERLSAPCMSGAAPHARGERVQGTANNSAHDLPTAPNLGRAVLRVLPSFA